MVFDSPQWKLVVDDIERQYAFVHNRLTVVPLRGPQRSVLMKVPTEFFPFIESVFDKKEMQAARSCGVDFFLDQQENGYWYLGFGVVGRVQIYRYLWMYKDGAVPSWMVP